MNASSTAVQRSLQWWIRNSNKPLPQNISYSCLNVCWQVSKYNDWKLQTSKHMCTQDLYPVPSPVHPVLQIEVISGSCAIQVSEETLPHPQATETAGPLSGQAWGCTNSGHSQSPWTLPVSMDTTSFQCTNSGRYQSPTVAIQMYAQAVGTRTAPGRIYISNFACCTAQRLCC